MAIIGIDLGTTNSLATVYRNGKIEPIPNALGEYLTPSAVSIDGNDIIVGAVAKERLVTHPKESAAAFKRKMGTEQRISLGKREFLPQELSAFVLKQLKEDAQRYLGEEVTEAVISVPAYFNDDQRGATREAGLLAGLTVERLVNEPSAAALAGSIGDEQKEGAYLVFDFGGGTLDVSVVDIFENVIEIVAVSGDNHLGGADFDRKIADHLCATHNLQFDELDPKLQATLLRLAEKSKQELTEKELVMYHCEIDGEDKGVFLNNEVLVKCCEEIFNRAGQTVVRALRDSGYTAEDLEDIILVGGSSKMPVVSYFLSSFMGREPSVAKEPDELVARGAGIYAGMKERNQDLKDLLLTDICPFSLGLGVYNHADDKRMIFSPVIERNSVLPCANTRVYANVHDGQRRVQLEVFQGEAYYCDENLPLGTLEMKLEPAAAGEAAIEVTFSYDINGILVVDAKNERNEGQKVFTRKNSRLTEKEINEKVKELEKYRGRQNMDMRAEYIMARGRRVFAECTGINRQRMGELLQAYEAALSDRDREAVVQLQKILEHFITELDV